MPRTPLVHSAAYFRGEDARLSRTLWVMVGAAVVLVALFIAMMSLFLSRIENPPAGTVAAVQSRLVVPALTLFTVSLVGWLLEAGVLHLLVRYLGDGTGTFTDTLAVAGWGAVPDAISAGFTFVLVGTSLAGRTLPNEPGALVAQAREIFGAGTAYEPVLLLLAAAWTVAIWGPGIAERHDVPRTGAYLFSGLVVGVGVVMSMG